MRCDICQRPIEEGWFAEKPITDGNKCYCPECARIKSNEFFNKVLRVFETEEEIVQKSFAMYGVDDFWHCVMEVMK